nr:hypothetical protein HmN_000246000 [Hymenolepis microstoma]
MDLGIASPELVCGAHESHSWVHQVYEYETAQALKQAPSHQASGEAIPNLNKPMSPAKGNSIRMACQTYQFGPKGVPMCNLGDIAEKDAQIRDLSERLAAHEKIKTKPWRKSYEMLRLKKRLADERKLKKIATHKVDDLLSPVPFIFLSPR